MSSCAYIGWNTTNKCHTTHQIRPLLPHAQTPHHQSWIGSSTRCQDLSSSHHSPCSYLFSSDYTITVCNSCSSFPMCVRVQKLSASHAQYKKLYHVRLDSKALAACSDISRYIVSGTRYSIEHAHSGKGAMPASAASAAVNVGEACRAYNPAGTHSHNLACEQVVGVMVFSFLERLSLGDKEQRVKPINYAQLTLCLLGSSYLR